MNATQQIFNSVEAQVKSLASAAIDARVSAVSVIDSIKSALVYEADRKGLDPHTQIQVIGYGDKHIKNLKKKGIVGVSFADYQAADYLDDAAIRVIEKIGNDPFTKVTLGYELQKNGVRYTDEEFDLMLKHLVKEGQIIRRRSRDDGEKYERALNAPDWVFKEPKSLDGRSDKIHEIKSVVAQSTMIESNQVSVELSYSVYKELLARVTPGDGDVIDALNRMDVLRGKKKPRKPNFYVITTLSKYGSDSYEPEVNMMDAIYNYGIDFDETYVRRACNELTQANIKQFMDNDYPELLKKAKGAIRECVRNDLQAEDKTNYVFTISAFARKN